MTVKTINKDIDIYKIEEQAGKLNDCIQVLYYLHQEVTEFKLPADREPTLDDIYARVPAICYMLLENMKEVRDELYNIFDSIH